MSGDISAGQRRIYTPDRGGKRASHRNPGPAQSPLFLEKRVFPRNERLTMPEVTRAAERPGQCQTCGRELPAPKTTVKGLPLGRPRLKCDECRSGRRKTPVTVPATGPCQLAAEATIVALQAAGHLEPADSSRVAALRATAVVVDADPLNAALTVSTAWPRRRSA